MKKEDELLVVSEEEVEEISSEETEKNSEYTEKPAILKVLLKIYHFVLDILLRIVFVFRDLGLGIWKGIKGIKNAFVRFGKRFMDGSIWTKLSHFIMGAGNFARKQYLKGFLFLSIQIIFILFMVASPSSSGTHLGAKAIGGFFSLGEFEGMPVDNSYDFNTEYSPIKELDMSGDEGLATLITSKIYRVNNVLAALEANDSNLTVVKNDGKIKEYERSAYKELIYDNRYGTNDIYAYSDLTGSSQIIVADNSVIQISSDTEIEFGNLNRQIEVDTSNTVYGLYCKKVTVEDEVTYQYILIVKTTANLGNTVYLDLEGTNLQISKLDYADNYVNRQVDNSFLMLLFGLITFAIIAVFIVIYNLSIASSYKADKDVKEGRKPTTFIEDLKTLLDSRFHITLLGPAIILLIVFTVVPTLLMILIAFTDMNKNGQSSNQLLINWTGFKNFADLFSGSSSGGSEIANEVGKNFTSVLTWTFEWAILATFSCYFGGIFLALLINKKDVKCKKLWRTIFILTIAIPQFITLLVLRNLLSGNGPINSMLKSIGLIDESINFLQSGTGSIAASTGQVWLARSTVLVINLYIGIPYTMLMTSGILMNIPKDLYEAATIDGANKWQMFRKITLPYVIFVTTPYLISSFIGNITSFNTIFLTTGGGPSKGAGIVAGHTDLLVTWLFKLTMQGGNSKYNAGSIIGILTFFITAFITLVCYRNSKAYKEEDTFQ